jgi:UMF1 family MFS transporter
MTFRGNTSPAATAIRWEIVGWCFYDWANSAFATTVLAAVLPIYFIYIVPERGVRFGLPGGPDWITHAPSLWAYSVSLSLLLVALSSPILGTIADRTGAKKRFLAAYALSGSLCTALLFFVRQGDVWLCLLLFMAANIGFSGGNVFYNAFLPQLVGPERMDRVSGMGFAYGYLGGGLLLALNLLMIQKPGLFGIPDTLLATRFCFVSVGIWWAVFSVPILTLLRERPPVSTVPLPRNLLTYGFKRVRQTVVTARQFSQLVRFLIAFLIYNDGIQTVILMATIFGSTELKMGAGTLLATLLLIQIVGVPGSLALGALAERYGVKRVLTFTLILWTGIVCYAFFIRTASQFVVLSVLVGIILGGSQALSRSLYARFVPPGHSAEFYGFYAISNKFASILGPFLFGLLADLTGNLRYSVLSVALFFLAGLILLVAVDVEKGVQEAAQERPHSL